MVAARLDEGGGGYPHQVTTRSKQYEQGWEALTRINQTTDPRVIRELEEWAPELADAVVEYGYGATYARADKLSDRDRQLATVASLIAMGGCESQLDVHFSAALKMGVSPQELTEILHHLTAFCGFPRVLNAAQRLRAAIESNERRA